MAGCIVRDNGSLGMVRRSHGHELSLCYAPSDSEFDQQNGERKAALRRDLYLLTYLPTFRRVSHNHT